MDYQTLLQLCLSQQAQLDRLTGGEGHPGQGSREAVRAAAYEPVREPVREPVHEPVHEPPQVAPKADAKASDGAQAQSSEADLKEDSPTSPNDAETSKPADAEKPVQHG